MKPSLPKPPVSSPRPLPPAPDSVLVAIAGEPVRLDHSGAALVPAHQALVVADLHCEKASAMAGRGGHLPPYDTRATLALVHALCARYRPRRLIFLGDSFHDGDGPNRLDDNDLESIFALARGRQLIWVTGNHDPALPDTLPGTVVDEVHLGALALRHRPEPGVDGEIAGHLHPAARLRTRVRRIRRKCFIADERRLILPAIGAFTGGLDVTDPAFGELFDGERFAVWMIAGQGLYRLPGHQVS